MNFQALSSKKRHGETCIFQNWGFWGYIKLSPKSITTLRGSVRLRPLFGTQQPDYFYYRVKCHGPVCHYGCIQRTPFTQNIFFLEVYCHFLHPLSTDGVRVRHCMWICLYMTHVVRKSPSCWGGCQNLFQKMFSDSPMKFCFFWHQTYMLRLLILLLFFYFFFFSFK